MTAKTPSTLLAQNSKEESKEWKTENQKTAIPFDRLVQESATVNSPKRGRGRPPKDQSKTAPSAQQDSFLGKTESGFGSPSPSATGKEPDKSSGAIPVSHLASTGIPLKLIQNAVELPFAAAAVYTECPLVALKPEESEPLAPQIDYVLAKHLPNLGPHGAEFMLAISIGGLVFSKFMAYQGWKKQHGTNLSNAQKSSEG